MPTRKQEDEPVLRFSLGNAITLVVIVLGVGFAWARMEARMASLEAFAKESNATLKEINASVQELSRWRDAQTGRSTTTQAPRR